MNTIGPISKNDFRTMSDVFSSLAYYKENNKSGKYDRAIERETPIYEGLLHKYGVKQ